LRVFDRTDRRIKHCNGLFKKRGEKRSFAMEKIDLIISAKWIVPIVPHDVVHEDFSIAVHAGKIVALAPSSEVLARYSASSHTDLRGENHVLIPGFVNAHTHTPMTLLRGYVDNVELMDWLQNYIWPVEGSDFSCLV
jgi:5-methylthioadenosine/S-adenosylhomocysteine deaminase